MNQSDEAWTRFRSEIEDLGRNLREQADVDELRRAGESVVEAVNRVVKDPGVRDSTRRTARSLGDAMAATLNQVADALRSQRR